jgi:hypothetical protein
MFIFGCAITKEEIYDECARPGILRTSGPDDELIALGTAGSLFRNYNLILDEVKDRDDFEGLILLHQDAEIVDPDFLSKVRRGLEDPEVAILGCAGAIGVHNIAWWEGSVVWASYTHRFKELGGGEIPAMTWREEEMPSYSRTGNVDSIDGFVMVLTPWATRNLRFDESLGDLHGYDFDLCMQAKEQDKKVAVESMRVVHHHNLELITGTEAWIGAHMRVAEKWHGRLNDIAWSGADWRYRARRAEAEASLERMRFAAAAILHDARITPLWDEYHRMRNSRSWRMTAPLRKAGKLFKRRGGGDS